MTLFKKLFGSAELSPESSSPELQILTQRAVDAHIDLYAFYLACVSGGPGDVDHKIERAKIEIANNKRLAVRLQDFVRVMMTGAWTRESELEQAVAGLQHRDWGVRFAAMVELDSKMRTCYNPPVEPLARLPSAPGERIAEKQLLELKNKILKPIEAQMLKEKHPRVRALGQWILYHANLRESPSE